MINHTCYMRKLLPALLILLLQGTATRAQQALTLEECYQMARANYPLVKQLDLIAQTREYTLENVSKGYLPQISVNGQATYQSAVTALPVSLPNINIPTVSKDQYKLYTEINQPITDIIAVNKSKEVVAAGMDVEAQKTEVALYQLKERINNLFFGMLLADAQIKQVELLKKDIQTGIDRANAAIANGVALKTSAQTLQAELLRANQKKIELQSARTAYAGMLSLFIHKQIDDQTTLTEPKPQLPSGTVNRPELKLYDQQKQYYEAQKKLVNAKNIPHVGVFAQGGYGRPALNMLNNDFDFYYLGGLRLNWSISGYYTAHKEKKILALNQDAIDVQKETFLMNTGISLSQQNTEAVKYQQLAASDNEIIALRETIKNTAKIQLESGTITTNDYLIHVNAEDQARQNMSLHKIQLLMAQYNYQTTSGN